MGGLFGGGGGTTTVRNDIPAELSPLFQAGAQRIQDLQRVLPLQAFATGDAFGNAARAPQFGQAQQQINNWIRTAYEPMAGRQLLNQRPLGTQDASNIAQAAESRASRVPSEFRNLRPVAHRQVGLQGLERSGLDRAARIGNIVGQTPQQFGNTRSRFQTGVGSLQQQARQVPSEFGQLRANIMGSSPANIWDITPEQARQEAEIIRNKPNPTRMELARWGLMNNIAQGRSREMMMATQGAGSTPEPTIRDLISQADRQITGEGIQDSPAFQAAQNAFQSTLMPTIQNQAALSGLGRSTGLTQSLAAGQAQYMLPIIQDELARQERGLERGLGARQFGIQTAADLGLQEALASERGIQRGVDIGQFGLATEADLGIQEALAGERALGRRGQAEQFTAGLLTDTGRQLAARQEDQIRRVLDANLQAGLAGERALGRGQAASQFRAGIEQAVGAQDLQRVLEGIGVDERARALQFDQSQAAVSQLMQLGHAEQAFAQAIRDRDAQDFLRRQALAEQALFQPFGMIAPSAIGQRSSSSGKKGK